MYLEFLTSLFAGASSGDYLTLWTMPAKDSYHFQATDTSGICSIVDNLKTKGAVYYGLGLHNRPLGKKQRGTKNDVIAIPGLWLDLDIRSAAHAQKNLPPDEDSAFNLIADIEIEPSVVIHSGYGLQAIWYFDKLWRFAPGQYQEAEGLVSRFQARFIERAEKKGWSLDNTADITRVLRLPGTFNYKIQTAEPKPVKTLLFQPDLRHSIERLCEEFKVKAPVSVPVVDPETAELKAIRDTLRERCKSEPVRNVLAGLPFAEEGKRDTTLASVCQTIANIVPNASVMLLVKLFDESLARMQALSDSPSNPALTRQDVIKKLQTAKNKKGRDTAVEKVVAETLSSMKPKTAPYAYPIIQYGHSYYIQHEEGYLSPIVREALPLSLKQNLGGVIDWAKYDENEQPIVNKEGRVQKLTVPEVVLKYGALVRKVVADLTLSESYHDESKEVFYEAVCPVRYIPAVFDPRVDVWLSLLGRSSTEKFLDWIATITDLRRQTCALYLSGPGKTGKTMLVHGLSKIWSTGGPTDIVSILGTFNSALLNCPLVFADEFIPEGVHGKRGSAELRQIIGTNSRTLRRKHLPDAELRGAVRLVLAANNDKLLQGDDEALSSDDMHAVAGRFLHIEVTEDAAKYLESIGGRKGTDGWVDGDVIASHALWLRDNRNVVPGSRFLVEGHVTSMHRRLSTQGRVAESIQEWLAKYLERPDGSITAGGGIKVGDGKYLVNTSTVVKFWDLYIKNDRNPPSMSRIGRALQNLSDGPQEYVGSLRCHSVDPELVYTFADDHQIGNVDQMRRKVECPFKSVPPEQEEEVA